MSAIAPDSLREYSDLLDQIGEGVPDAEQYQRLSGLVLDFPKARELAQLDPFSSDYKAKAMELYLLLRGRTEQGYVATRDEAPAVELPENLWTGLVPWSFRDAKMVSEHLLAWGHILNHLNLPPGGSLLEYGPGSGQLLLMSSRMGYRCHGVDIDAVALAGIKAQSAHLGLPVEIERAEFGRGFDGRKFDSILFYEAFHHAFDFDHLLIGLHDKLNPAGRVILCGEPVVTGPTDSIPYPWGPRLDGLSVFCIRRFGWMELGFTHEFFVQMANRTGWNVAFHPFPNCGRAAIYVLEAKQGISAHVPEVEQEITAALPSPESKFEEQICMLKLELAAMQASTSWRMTAPLRAIKRILRPGSANQ